jgi:hypothetical protein
MHLFDTDDPKVIASQRWFYVTICLFASSTYVFALGGYPLIKVWQQGLRKWQTRFEHLSDVFKALMARWLGRTKENADNATEKDHEEDWNVDVQMKQLPDYERV